MLIHNIFISYFDFFVFLNFSTINFSGKRRGEKKNTIFSKFYAARKKNQRYPPAACKNKREFWEL